MLAEDTKTVNVIFSNFAEGAQYADNEKHDLGEGLVIYTTDCHFTTELRIYSSTTYNGYVVSDPLPGAITQMTFNMGYKLDKLEVYGSNDGENWILVKEIETYLPSYWDYSCEFPSGGGYTRFKLDVKGGNQIRIKSMSVTFIDNGSSEGENPTEPEIPTEPSNPNEPSTSNNTGERDKPYTVEEVKIMKEYLSNKWMKGTIYGTMVGADIANIKTSDFSNKNNIVLGNAAVQVPVQLSESKKIQDKINLVDHPYLKGKELLILGDLYEYGKSKGVTSPEQYEITYEIPINNYGYASLYLDMPAKVPTGSTAYYCTTDGDMAYLTPVGSIIPDSVGVIITSTPGTTCVLTYTTASNDKEEAIRAANQLIGFAEDTTIPADNYTYYALNAKEDKVGFYVPQTTTEEGFVAKAYKAYLRVPTEQKVAAYYLPNNNDETGIVPITHISEDIIYDLQGRVVTNPTQGMYIKGGKKIVIQ